MQSGVGGDLLELYTGPKANQKPFVYYKSLVEYQQSPSQHFEIFKKKQDQVATMSSTLNCLDY